MTSPVVIRRFDEPDHVSRSELGRFDMVDIDGRTVGRARYEPGWRWSTHIGARTGERFCRVAHVGMVVSGRNLIEMADGQRFEIGPGDIFAIAPGHDSAVIGDEPSESLHVSGAGDYAR